MLLVKKRLMFVIALSAVILMNSLGHGQEEAEQKRLGIFFRQETDFTRFQKPDTIQAALLAAVKNKFEVKVVLYEALVADGWKVNAKDFKTDSITLGKKLKPTHLLVIVPGSASQKILTGEIRLYELNKQSGLPEKPVPFGSDKADLSTTISKKATSLLNGFPPKRKILGMSRSTFEILSQAILTSGAIVLIGCTINDDLSKLPKPKPLPDVP